MLLSPPTNKKRKDFPSREEGVGRGRLFYQVAAIIPKDNYRIASPISGTAEGVGRGAKQPDQVLSGSRECNGNQVGSTEVLLQNSQQPVNFLVEIWALWERQ